ncbi:MAG: bifunctional adenosylcobinamide kinase/adenosylcobinamide-phosphate guanylyltransferase [Acidimicrobiales bacterium]
MITLVLGGARSGKSQFAEDIARCANAPVTYVATLSVDDDAELKVRVEAHRLRRPPDWNTVECRDDLATLLVSTTGTVLVDSLGPWLAGQPSMNPDTIALCDALRTRQFDTIVVSDEVGQGVHPETALGREFRDALGRLNQEVANVADAVYLVVAGRALSLPRGDDT